jgi:preprotein translocase subunit SecE
MPNKIVTFFNEAKQELGKVVWPSREELLGSTVVVVVTTLLLAAFIGVVDVILSFAIRILVRV